MPGLLPTARLSSAGSIIQLYAGVYMGLGQAVTTCLGMWGAGLQCPALPCVPCWSVLALKDKMNSALRAVLDMPILEFS